MDQKKEERLVQCIFHCGISAFSPYCVNSLLSTPASFTRMRLCPKMRLYLCMVVSVTVAAANEVYHLIRIS